MSESIIIFTDGASRLNPGPGGYGAIIVSMNKTKVTEVGGREALTTNNKMELRAALEALEYVESRNVPGDIEMYTDSSYLLNGITGWVYAWEKNGWKTKDGTDVQNQDLWKKLAAIIFRFKSNRIVIWHKIEGHTGLRGNEQADTIATTFADGQVYALFSGSLTEYERFIGGNLFDKDSEREDSKTRTKTKAYSYVSSVDGMVEIHKTWEECEERVKGKSGAKFKKSISKEDENIIVGNWLKANQ